MTDLKVEWARSVAILGPSAPVEYVKALRDICKPANIKGKPPPQDTVNQLIQRLVPLVEYLNRSNCQHADLLIPEIAAQLPLITSTWLDPYGDANSEVMLTRLMVGLRSIIRSPDVKGDVAAALSSAVQAILDKLFTLYQFRGVSSDATVEPPSRSYAALLMRCLTRSESFTRDSTPPLTHSHAVALLHKQIQACYSHNGVLFFDSKPIVLMTSLVRAFLPSHLGPSLLDLAEASFVSARSILESVGSSESGREVLSAEDAALLASVAEWAISTVRRALNALLGLVGPMSSESAVDNQKQPTGAIARSAAKLAGVATAGLVQYSSYDKTKSPEVQGQLTEVLDVLFNVAEASVVAAETTLYGGEGSAAAAAETRDRLLGAAASVAQDCAALAASVRSLGMMDSTSVFAQRRDTLMMAAALAPSTAGRDSIWSWDIRRSLPLSTKDAPGQGAKRLCSLLAEGVSLSLAMRWNDGQHSFVQAMLLLPDPSTSSAAEQQVTVLVIGRVYVLLGCRQDFARMVLPTLMDSVISAHTRPPAQTYACLAATIAAMASANACSRDVDKWTYDQAVDLLMRIYKDSSSGASKALLYASSQANSALCGTLAEALHTLASGMNSAKPTEMKDVRLRLLALFCDLGFKCGSNPAVMKDMQALLPAIAAACDSPTSQKGEGGQASLSSGNRLSYATIAAASKNDATYIKLIRNLWLYIGMFKLVTQDEGPEAGKHSAIGQIAATTPLLFIGVHGDAELLERLKAEFGDRLSHAGSPADPSSLNTSLLSLLGVSSSSVTLPLDAHKKAYLLALATCELSRATLSALPARGQADPMSTALGYVQVTDPLSEEMPWMVLIAEQTFTRYLTHIEAELGRQKAKEHETARALEIRDDLASDPFAMKLSAQLDDIDDEMEGGEVGDGSLSPGACIEGLALTLINHLSSTEGGSEEGKLPKVVQLSDKLLKRLLTAHPSLYWSRACGRALLGMLEAEEGDRPLGEVPISHAGMQEGSLPSSMVWKWLQSWVLTAAGKAPSRTEALIHQFLGQRGSLVVSSGNIRSPFLKGHGSFGKPSEGLTASPNALRRASELLSICARARRESGHVSVLSRGPGAALQNGTLALCRKQYYAGIISGMQATQPGTSDASALATMLSQALDAAVRNRHSLEIIEERFLTAAALMATSPLCVVESGPCFNLLRSLNAMPLNLFSPEALSIFVFACNWITAAAPTWLLPLSSRATSSWCWTVDQGWGLFSGRSPRGSDLNPGSVIEGIRCHEQWLQFFTELWGTLADSSTLSDQASSVLYLFERMLQRSLSDPEALSGHPAAASTRFRLLSLALKYGQYSLAALLPASASPANAGRRGAARTCPPTLAILHDRILKAAVMWFAHPPSFSAHITEQQAQDQVTALKEFLLLVSNVSSWPTLGGGSKHTGPKAPVVDMSPGDKLKAVASQAMSKLKTLQGGKPVPGPTLAHPVWGGGGPLSQTDVVMTLKFLLSHEIERLQVWSRPLEESSSAATSIPGGIHKANWEALVETTWRVHPEVALALSKRFPTLNEVSSKLHRLLVAHAMEPSVQVIPEAGMILAASMDTPPTSLAALHTWTPSGPVEGLELLAGSSSRRPEVKAYALRCIDNTKPEQVVFFLPQLVQILRHDPPNGPIQTTLMGMAGRSSLFAHQLMWALQTEEKPPEEAFNPEVKRSGWQPPKDCGLWTVSGQLRQKVLQSLQPSSRSYWEAESSYFDQITAISGILKKYEKDERKSRIAEELVKFEVPRQDLYVPTNPDCRVLSHIPSSGTPMQSAAKVPILVAFKVSQAEDTVKQLEEGEEPAAVGTERNLACIFKVGDDVRQDVLALQVIQLLRDAFVKAGLDLYLCPYGCLPTGYERGIIEVVPKTKSRAALGELSDRGLYEIFQTEFGAANSPAFEAARRNFIVSEAGYAIASYLLQAKDRHNGNLLVDSDGHLVHIDFGFILEISPGGNMGFESAAFKLSHEMTQLLDPGSTKQSSHFKLFEQLCVRGYLVARTVAEPIIATVALMAESGLPCFGRGAPIENLRKRFHLEMSERQAAQFMRQTISDAYQKWTTGVYDALQNIQNRIPF